MNFKHVKLEYYSHEQVASGTRLGLYSWLIRKGRGKQGFGMVPRMSRVSHPSIRFSVRLCDWTPSSLMVT